MMWSPFEASNQTRPWYLVSSYRDCSAQSYNRTDLALKIQRTSCQRSQIPGIQLTVSLIACWVILHVFLSSAELFQKESFRNTIRVLNSFGSAEEIRCVFDDI